MWAQLTTIMIPIKRINEAEEIADSIVWLLTQAPDNLTGQVIHLDGGMSQILAQVKLNDLARSN